MPTDKKSKFNLPEREEKILKFWEERKIFEKSLAKNKKGKVFVFYEGPPTANGAPGIHHVEARAFKDIICRYKTMQGSYVPRRAGWDTHGLPVEIQVEKELDFKTKQDIEKYGIAKFNAKAKESVWRYKEEWERLTKRMGYWIDLDNPYITYETSYIEKLWGIIKEFWKKGLLYEDFKVVPWCPRCQTGLSSHEMGLGYKEVEDTAVYVKFKLKSGQKIGKFTTDDKTRILSWTTTPWTLPGNAALAVGKDIEYVFAEAVGEFVIVAASRLDAVAGKDARVLKKLSADELIGVDYEPLFDVRELQSETSHRVYAAPFVSATEGTGVVHTAVMYGEDDYRLGAQVGLPKFHTVTEDGKFVAGLKDLAGMAVKDKATEEKIIEVLDKKGLLFKKEKYRHEYPHCWRCETPLLYYARKAWWVKTTAVKKELLANNEKINWVPAHIKRGRFGEFLRDLRDWAFSRERYWGTPLPIWKCEKCGNTEVIGSCEELKKRAGRLPENDKGEVDLHRPYADEMVFGCSRCGGAMRRIPEVADVWFDSGAMPFAQSHYPFRSYETRSHRSFSGRLGLQKLAFPADYICEAVDQTRGWFYTLLAVGTLLGKGPAYKNVISLGHVLDKNGQKMSKSKGNVVNPWEMMEKYGADALRWYFYTVNAPGEQKRFDEKDVETRRRGFIGTLWNSFVFWDTYVKKAEIKSIKPTNVLDKWIMGKLNMLVGRVTAGLNEYDVVSAARAIDEFAVNDFSQWYIRRSRRRFQHPESAQEKAEAVAVMAEVLASLAELAAPFAPFVAEVVYQGLRKKMGLREESVHLRFWPKSARRKAKDVKLLQDMEVARAIVAEGLKLRAEAGIKVRQPLLELSIKNPWPGRQELRTKQDLLDLIKDEVNVKEITFGEELKLDTAMTRELKEEGIVREFIRTIQEMRRDLGFSPKDGIRCLVDGDAEMLAILSRHGNLIKDETGMREFGAGKKTSKPASEKQIDFEGKILRIQIMK